MNGNVKENLEAEFEMVEFQPHTDKEGKVHAITLKYVPKPKLAESNKNVGWKR